MSRFSRKTYTNHRAISPERGPGFLLSKEKGTRFSDTAMAAKPLAGTLMAIGSLIFSTGRDIKMIYKNLKRKRIRKIE